MWKLKNNITQFDYIKKERESINLSKCIHKCSYLNIIFYIIRLIIKYPINNIYDIFFILPYFFTTNLLNTVIVIFKSNICFSYI